MLKTLKKIFKLDKEKFKVPRSVLLNSLDTRATTKITIMFLLN